jgi:galactokinase
MMGMPSVSCFAPGRVELLGNHTDYNEGYVLSASIPFGVRATGSRRDDGRIILSTEFRGERLRHEVAEGESPVRRGDWTDYPLGVVEVLREAGHPVGGFEASFASDLPPGAGLSSSAALEVSTILLLSKLFAISLPGIELAKLCRRAENAFVGVQCGLLDQVSSLFGKRDHAVFLDCRTTEVRAIAFPRDVSLLLIQSGVPHALVGGEYNERREQCHAAAAALGVPFLRDATSAQLASSTLPDAERRRAAHVIGENERVLRTVELLAAGDVAEVGRLMTASHGSSRVNFENSTPALDLLVSIAVDTPGVFGARLTGGGFGGAIVALVSREASRSAGEAIVAEYGRRSGHHAELLECDLADGALALDSKNAPA